MSFPIRRAALTSVGLALVAALLPAACSSKAPNAEAKIRGCLSDDQCASGVCDDGVCVGRCGPDSCPFGQSCGENGRCVSGGGGTSGGTSSTGGGETGGTGGTLIPIEDAGRDPDDGSLNPDAACGTGSAEAKLTPVSMFVMFDRSGSMVQNGSTRWANAALALTTFFKDPAAADLAVALRFFPDDMPVAGCTNDTRTGCSSDSCAQPLVPLMADPAMPLPKLTAEAAPTDALEQSLLDAVAASTPMDGQMGGTPTHPALQGALAWATAYQTAHPRPEQQTVVVLVTDGYPNGCGNGCTTRMNQPLPQTCYDGIEALATDALATSQIRTYVVGLTDVPADLAFLDNLAVAGGTDKAFIVLDGATAATELGNALKAIQGNALACDFEYPMVADGGMSDPDKINVDYTPSAAGSAKVPFFRVDNEAACASSTEPSWYYDDPAAPKRIFLCPSACTRVTADTGAKLDIQIGCTSRPPPPPA